MGEFFDVIKAEDNEWFFDPVGASDLTPLFAGPFASEAEATEALRREELELAKDQRAWWAKYDAVMGSV